MKDKTYPYRVSYLHGRKTKEMQIEAETREHARLLWQGKIDDMQAFTESGSDIFQIISIRQLP